MIGKTISHYTIIEKLGQGGMGVVYKAQDTKLDRFVALKFLPPALGEDEEQKSRFMLEAKAASAIDHPNIASIYEINDTPDGQIFIAMGYYEGDTLRKQIEDGQMTIDRVLDSATQIAQGLAKAHEHGIIHRDLKPANVITTRDGTVKIIDFGLAKLAGGVQMTRSRTSVGTAAYMSPEQARAEEVDPRTDIWSLGVVMYQMLTGQLPFRGEFETAMMYCIVNEDPPPISTLRNDVPREFEEIVEKALKKDRDQRYLNMGEVVEALTTLRRNIQSGMATDTSKQLVSRLIHTVVRKHRTVLIAAGATLVIAIAGVFILRSHVTAPASSINRSITVLPFVNLGDSSDNYFSDGLSQDVYSQLSKFPDLRIISSGQTLARVLSGSTITEKSAGAELGVGFVIRGEVDVLPTRSRIKIQLFDTEKGEDVWDDSYIVNRGDILTLQESIMNQVAKYLQLDYDSSKHAGHRPTGDVFDWYLRGLYSRGKTTKDDNKMAIEYFTAAVSGDSIYVPALLNLASTQVEHYRQGWGRSKALLTNAEKICQRVLRLDSTQAQAYAVLGNIADVRGNGEEAIRLLQKAISKEPHNLFAVTSIVLLYLTELNAPGKAVVYLEQLHELEPTDWLTTLNLGVGYAQLKNYPKAKQAFHRSMELNPNHEWPPYSLAYTCERIGEIDSSISYYLIAIGKNPKSARTYEGLVSVLLANKKFAKAESVMVSGMKYLQGDPEWLYALGVVYNLGGKQALASRTFEEGSRLIDERILKNPGVGDNCAFSGLFQARLGNVSKATTLATEAAKLSSSDEEVLMKVARIFAVLGKKTQMLDWFGRAKSMNPEYDAAYLATALDFEKFRTDVDLLTIARRE